MTRWSYATNGFEVVEAFKDRVAGKTILVTGPSVGGIGAETALSLAAGLPSLIILTGRTESKIAPVISDIKSRHPSVEVKFVPIDLSSLASVRVAAAAISALAPALDILILNAAVMVCPYSTTEDGVEMQFGTNYLGHFLLTNLVRENVLKAARGARIVCLSSSAHNAGRVRFGDVNFEDGKVYNEWEAYGQSKTAMILFAEALASKLGPYGGFSYSLHPGSISSNLQTYMFANGSELLSDGLARATAGEAAMGRKFVAEGQKTLQQGCSTSLIAALDPSIESQSGAYLRNGDVWDQELIPYAKGRDNWEKLWLLSETLVGEKFVW